MVSVVVLLQIALRADCISRTLLDMCKEYCVYVNYMYLSAHGVDNNKCALLLFLFFVLFLIIIIIAPI